MLIFLHQSHFAMRTPYRKPQIIKGKRKHYLEYERTGLLDALQGMGRLGECCVTLCGVSEHCVVWIRDYDADGTDRAYKPIREALEIIDGSAG